MSLRSIIDQLPEGAREWLRARLNEKGFADYEGITAELNAKLPEFGVEITVSKSTVNRFGQEVEENIRRIKASTEVARTLAREVGDDEGALSDAIMRLVQDKTFGIMMALSVDPEKASIDKLTKVGHMVADLGRATVAQKKHMVEVRAKVDEKLKSLEREAKGGKSKLDPETLRRVREEVYGLL